MIKYILPLMLISLSACGQSRTTTKADQKITDTTTYTVAKPAVSALLIDPGKGIGRVKLNVDANKLAEMLGKPDQQDSGMGGTMMTWFANHNTTAHSLTVYARRNMGAEDENVAHIKQIRITSPQFSTIDSVKVGSTLKDITKLYNVQLKQAAGKGMTNAVQVYDDRIRGISFEVDAAKVCTAIRVHLPYDKAAAGINMKAN